MNTCTVPGLLLQLGSSAAHITIGLGLIVSVGAIVSCLVLAGACSASCSFRLASHALPIVTGRFAGSQRVDRADRVCSHCANESVADEWHIVFECIALAATKLTLGINFGRSDIDPSKIFGDV